MLIPIHRVKLSSMLYKGESYMLITKHGLKLYAHCYIWSESLCLFLFMECSFMLLAIHGVKLYAHCYAWIEALRSILYTK